MKVKFGVWVQVDQLKVIIDIEYSGPSILRPPTRSGLIL